MACSNHTRWRDMEPFFIDRYGKPHHDEITNPDPNTIPGFHSGRWQGQGGEYGKVFKNEGDPVSTHVHYHSGGITISTFNRQTGRVERFTWPK